MSSRIKNLLRNLLFLLDLTFLTNNFNNVDIFIMNVMVMSSKKEQVSISLSRDLIDSIDRECKGLIPRSALVEKILREHYTAKPKLVSV